MLVSMAAVSPAVVRTAFRPPIAPAEAGLRRLMAAAAGMPSAVPDALLAQEPGDMTWVGIEKRRVSC